MSGADWRQQEELEEQQWHEEVDIFEFVNGQRARKEGGRMPEGKSLSFIRGWEAQREIEETSPL